MGFASNIKKDEYMLRRFSGPNKEGEECYAYVLCTANAFNMVKNSGMGKIAPERLGIIVLKGMGKPTEETDREARMILKQQYLKAA